MDSKIVAQGARNLLIDMKNLLSDPAKWTKGLFATDANGNPAHPRDANAVCFCMLGAFGKCSENYEDNNVVLLADATLNRLCNRNVPAFNDNSTHAEMLARLQKAIDCYDHVA